MTDAKLAKLKGRRSTIISQQLRVQQFLKENLKTASLVELEVRLESLEKYFVTFDTVQTQIEELDDDESATTNRADYEELYFTLRPCMLVAINELKAKEQNLNGSPKETSHVNVKLPKVPLPIFAGELTGWLTYYETFKNLVHNNNTLDSISRFHYLRSSLTGSALKRIESIEVTPENYETALRLLISRHDKRALITQAHIRKLFTLPNISKISAGNLRDLIDTVQSHLRALKSLGRPVDHWDDIVIYLILSKLDGVTLDKWNDECVTERLPTLEELIKFLEKRCLQLEGPASTRYPNSSSSNFHHKENMPKVIKSTFTAATKKPTPCTHCNMPGHKVHRCKKFIDLTTENRRTFARSASLCYNCLKSGHSSNNCSSEFKCRECSGSHHSLLHLDHFSTKANSSQPITQSGSDQLENGRSTQNAYHSSGGNYDSTVETNRSHILLATALVQLRGKNNENITGRALLDSGSQLHFMTEELAKQLGLRRIKVNVPIGGIGDTSIVARSRMNTSIRSLVTEYESPAIEFHIIPKISEFQPDSHINLDNWNIPKHIHLADANFFKSNKIDLLIGAEIYFDLLDQGQLKIDDNLPVLQKTVLGWIISGKIHPNTAKYHCNVATRPSISSLEKLVQQFWEIERHDQPSPRLTAEEHACEEHFASTFKRLKSGQFVVRVPFREEPSSLGNSMSVAKRRLISLERKLSRDMELKTSYSEFMSDYIKLEHMNQINSIPPSNFVFPHHCVIKPESSSTKLRVVFDGSAKSSSGKSLNDILMTGPTVQSDLFSIITRFRIHRYVFTADISKMYRRILVDPSDRKYQLVLWRNHPDDPINYFQLNTVTYGTSAAPYLATRCLNQLAVEEKVKFPEESDIILRDMYVDDCMSGSDNLHKAKLLLSNLIELLKLGNFKLHKFCANNQHILQNIPESDREKLLKIHQSDVIKALGLIWQPKEDVFQFFLPASQSLDNNTKRTVLSAIGRIFDPLGVIGPVIVLGKIFFQQLWKMQLSWDDKLPNDIESRWQKYLQQLEVLKSLKIKRHILPLEAPTTIELHAFSDSSEIAYGACCYMRSTDQFGQISVHLICSKSRVAPLKNTTIPRLELCAALLMTELVHRLLTILPITFNKVAYYTDSKDVLAWLSSPSYAWSTFVANRVAKIQDLTALEQWHYINTNENPADYISRGALPNVLLASSLWFNGPDQLYKSTIETNMAEIVSSHESSERRHAKYVLTTTTKTYNVFENLRHSNLFLKLNRIFGYCARFLYNCRIPNKVKYLRSTRVLTVAEMNDGLNLIIKHVQLVAFYPELKMLRDGKQVDNSSRVRSLHPFIDHAGIIRVGGRIKNASIPFDAKHQILLPKNNIFTNILYIYFHNRHMHAAPQSLLAIIRQKYWPIDGKNLARRAVNKCVICFKAKPKSIHQLMGSLPAERVSPSRPFMTTGIDFCGPVKIYSRVRGKPPVKAYIAVFICFATKAVHLELVGDLSSEAFLAALKRFTSRRGLCKTIFCDNATNFLGCKNDLQHLAKLFETEALKTKLQKLCLEDHIQWKPIPPRSPHFGGLWEAAVKVAKYHLLRVTANASLTYEQLNTIVIQIEAVLNSRPLTPLSSDPNDLDALTPGHFLINAPLVAIPEPNITEVPSNRLSYFRQVEQIKQTFWRRWSTEYLTLLQQRNKWSAKETEITIGTLVLIADDNLPSLKWLLGRIIKLYPGTDGISRVADVRTKAGVFKRSIVKLHPLPTEDCVEDTGYLQGGRHVQS